MPATRKTRPATRTLAPTLAALAALALAAAHPQVARAQSLTLGNGDALTVNSTGTHGTYGGGPLNNSTTSYTVTGDNGTAVFAKGSSTFTLGSGGALSAPGTNGTALDAGGSGPVTISGGALSASGSNGDALFAHGSGSVTVLGGTFTGGAGGDALFASQGSIDLFGAFTGLTPGQTLLLPGGGFSGSFFGTLENNAAGQTFSYTNFGTITLHNAATAATVPEPSGVAAFAFTGLGAAALMLRARKHTA